MCFLQNGVIKLLAMVRTGLLFFAFTFDCLFGDVFRLQSPDGFNVADFKAFVVLHAATDAHDTLFVNSEKWQWQWQMLGYAAFFPVEGGPLLYVAKKRRYGENVADNSGEARNLFSSTTNMHTERQLVIAALEEAALVDRNIQIAAEGAVIPGAIVVPIINKCTLNSIQGMHGSLHVYTKDNPCQNNVPDNGRFSCIAYYCELARFTPNVNLNIYFPGSDMRLNTEFINTIQKATDTLCDFIDKNQLIGHLWVADEWLQCYHKSKEIKLVQRKLAPETGRIVWDIETAKKAGKIKLLVTTVNNCLKEKKFSISQADEMFNKIHNLSDLTNIKYHAI